MKELSFKKGDVIFRAGEIAHEMFYMNGGTVEIFVQYGTPAQRKVADMKVGDYFGEMGIIDGMPRPITAVAAEDSLVTAIEKETFNEFIAEHPEIAVEIMQILSGRLRNMMGEFMEACKTIAEMAEETKTKKPDLRARLKKYSDMYINSATIVDEKTGEGSYFGSGYYGDIFSNMMF